ncbi:hypothetical protein BH09VER1_BH09VER1_44470 [soil metagenome]
MSSNASWHKEKWTPLLNWDTPTGSLLRQAVKVLEDRLKPEAIQIIVFGSSPLQMGVSTAITSGDLDIASDDDIQRLFTDAHLSKGQSSPYIEVCPTGTFRTALDWKSRCHIEKISWVEILFPHPIDILVSKVRRGEEKDLEAFEEVIRKSGHPTELELKESLMRAVHLYRPGYDEEVPGDPIYNTQILWQRLFGRDIDVRKEIIVPGNSGTRPGEGV